MDSNWHRRAATRHWSRAGVVEPGQQCVRGAAAADLPVTSHPLRDAGKDVAVGCTASEQGPQFPNQPSEHAISGLASLIHRKDDGGRHWEAPDESRFDSRQQSGRAEPWSAADSRDAEREAKPDAHRLSAAPSWKRPEPDAPGGQEWTEVVRAVQPDLQRQTRQFPRLCAPEVPECAKQSILTRLAALSGAATANEGS